MSPDSKRRYDTYLSRIARRAWPQAEIYVLFKDGDEREYTLSREGVDDLMLGTRFGAVKERLIAMVQGTNEQPKRAAGEKGSPVTRLSIHRIDDVAGRQWEISWDDASGEGWSEECVDDADVVERLRDLLANGSPPGGG